MTREEWEKNEKQIKEKMNREEIKEQIAERNCTFDNSFYEQEQAKALFSKIRKDIADERRQGYVDSWFESEPANTHQSLYPEDLDNATWKRVEKVFGYRRQANELPVRPNNQERSMLVNMVEDLKRQMEDQRKRSEKLEDYLKRNDEKRQ